MADIEYVADDACVGWSAIGGYRHHCPARPKYRAASYPVCGLHVSWVLARLVRRGRDEILVRPWTPR